MSDQAQVYVDYTVFTPLGKLSSTAGPFNSDKEAQGIIEELRSHHKQLLLRAELRRAKKAE